MIFHSSSYLYQGGSIDLHDSFYLWPASLFGVMTARLKEEITLTHFASLFKLKNEIKSHSISMQLGSL